MDAAMSSASSLAHLGPHQPRNSPLNRSVLLRNRITLDWANHRLFEIDSNNPAASFMRLMSESSYSV